MSLFDRDFRWVQRSVLFVVLVASALGGYGCGGGQGTGAGGGGGAGANGQGGGAGGTVPLVCTVGCPAGYTCNDVGVCVGGDALNLILDVPTVSVTGRVTHNGQLPATGPQCGSCSDCTKATVVFTDALGSSFSADIACASAYTFALDLPPGTYTVAVSAASEDYTGLPRYGRAVVNPSLVLTGPVSNMVLDVPTVPVSGSVKHNGQLPATGPQCGSCSDCTKATVVFTDTLGSSFSADIPCSSAYTFAADVPPGTYAVAVSAASEDYTGLPRYGRAVVNPLLAVTGPVSNMVLDVPTVPVSGSVKHNGQLPATGPQCGSCSDCTKATVVFTDAVGSSFSADIPCSSAYTFAANVPPGTYTVAVSAASEDYTGLPRYGRAVVNPSLAVTGAVSNMVLDVPTVPVSGSVTHNGQLPGTGPQCGSCSDCTKATVVFTDTVGSSFSADIACSSAYTFALDLSPGTYAVAVSAASEDYTGLPRYGRAVVKPSLAVTGAVSNMVLDVPTVPVNGSVTHNGQLPATGPQCGSCSDCTKATVVFTDTPGSSFSADIACSSDYKFAFDVPPGVYMVAVSAASEDYTGLPRYGRAVVAHRLAIP